MIENLSETVTSILAFVVVAAVFVLIGMGMSIPPEVWAAFGLVLGFFFGNQTGTARTAKK